MVSWLFSDVGSSWSLGQLCQPRNLRYLLPIQSTVWETNLEGSSTRSIKERCHRGSRAIARGITAFMGVADHSSPRSHKHLSSEELLRYWMITFLLKVRLYKARSWRADEYVVFVAPSKLQLKIFQTLLAPGMLTAFLQSRAQPLGFSKLRFSCESQHS